MKSQPAPPGATQPGAANAPTADQLCNCTDTEPDSADFRTAAKHVDMPQGTPQEIAVTDILGWSVPPEPAFDAPRTGRELQLFHIASAFVQLVVLQPGDCDLHIEISAVPDKNAPRVIVETPKNESFCPARQNLLQQLNARGMQMTGELATPPQAEVLGLAFQDFNHQRGSPMVATPWELHPAIVTLK